MLLRWVIASVGLITLPGCLGAGSGAGGPLQRDVMRSVSLYDGDVVVRGPTGYCVDRRSLRMRPSQSFVVLASCESLSGVRGAEVEPVVMTLTILPDQAGTSRPSATEIAASAPTLVVIKSIEGDDFSLVHFASGGDRSFEGKDQRHWRGAMTVNGHLIGLALYGRKGSASAGEDGQTLLLGLAQNTKAASPVRPLFVDASVE